MNRRLLLLGLLRSQEMHGYQLNDFIDSHLGAAVELKKPTAYRLLNKMADDGWITFTEEREGKRPPRRVYAIAPEGETAFQYLLRESLAGYEHCGFPGATGFLFLHAIPVNEAIPLLEQRRAQVGSFLKEARAHEMDHGSLQLVLSHQTRHLETELHWLGQVIDHLAPATRGYAPADAGGSHPRGQGMGETHS
jgi:DNA-binding PadR family transcriptional regulator